MVLGACDSCPCPALHLWRSPAERASGPTWLGEGGKGRLRQATESHVGQPGLLLRAGLCRDLWGRSQSEFSPLWESVSRKACCHLSADRLWPRKNHCVSPWTAACTRFFT